MRDRELGVHDVLPRIPAAHRTAVRVALCRFDAEYAIQAHDPREALRRIARVLPIAREHVPKASWDLERIAAVAWRMIDGPVALEQSLAAYRRASEALAWGPPGETKRLQRWILASTSSPLAALGRWYEGREVLNRAWECMDDDPVARAETQLLHARIEIGLGDLASARVRIENAEELAADGPRWLHGWLPRYRFDLGVADAGLRVERRNPREMLSQELSEGWQLNKGYRFQEELMLRRMEDLAGTGVDIDHRFADQRRSIKWWLDEHHRRRHGRSTARCTTCSGARLQTVIRHALARSG